MIKVHDYKKALDRYSTGNRGKGKKVMADLQVELYRDQSYARILELPIILRVEWITGHLDDKGFAELKRRKELKRGYKADEYEEARRDFEELSRFIQRYEKNCGIPRAKTGDTIRFSLMGTKNVLDDHYEKGDTKKE